MLSLLLYGSTFWNVGSFTPRHREFLVATDTRHPESDHTGTCELGGSVRAIRHWYLPALVPPAAAVEAAAGDTPAPGVLLLLYSCCGGRRHLVYYSCSGGRRHAGIWCVTLVAAAGGTWCITRSNKTTGISATAAALLWLGWLQLFFAATLEYAANITRDSTQLAKTAYFQATASSCLVKRSCLGGVRFAHAKGQLPFRRRRDSCERSSRCASEARNGQ